VDQWIKDHGGDPFSGANGPTRNREWGHMVNDDIISMPDKRIGCSKRMPHVLSDGRASRWGE